MGSGGSKKPTTNASNNAGTVNTGSDQKSAEKEGNSLPPLKPQTSSADQKNPTATSSVTKLPEVKNSSSEAMENTPSKTNDTANLPVTSDQKVSNSSPPKQESITKKENPKVTEEQFVEPEDQRKFDDFICSACVLVKPDSLTKKITKNVTKLQLSRALPWNYNFYDILTKFTNLQVSD